MTGANTAATAKRVMMMSPARPVLFLKSFSIWSKKGWRSSGFLTLAQKEAADLARSFIGIVSKRHQRLTPPPHPAPGRLGRRHRRVNLSPKIGGEGWSG